VGAFWLLSKFRDLRFQSRKRAWQKGMPLIFSLPCYNCWGPSREQRNCDFGSLKLAAAIALLLIGPVLIIDRTVLPAAQKDSVTWDAVFAWIQRDWPEVSQMSTRELAQRMAAKNGATPLLIDVRTREEYEVSHLPGAIWAQTPSQIASAMRAASDQKPIVLYCSVGVRSSRAAAKLMESRRANVFNLQGSIFQWANEGRPLMANDRAVHVVHPYNERWGDLLNPELHPHAPN
jgi:rhodanese-related sulfurtransferase